MQANRKFLQAVNYFVKISLKKSVIFKSILAFFLFFIAANYITFPLIFNLGSLSTGLGDELVMAWIHNSVIHGLLTHPLSLFEANLYYPYHNTLAFAESLIFTSILTMPIQKLLVEPIVSVNFTLLSSLTLLGFSLFLLSYYLSKDFLVSVLSGVLVIFSPAVLDHTTHLQVLTIEWIPLSVLCFLHFLKTEKSRFFVLSLIFFVFQTYSSFMTGYFIIITLFIIFIYNFFYIRKKSLKLITKKNILLLLLTILFIIPVTLPYYNVSKEFHYARDLRDAIHLAIQPEDLLYSSSHSRLYKLFLSLPFNQRSQNGEFQSAYLGMVFSALSILALIYFIKNFKKKFLIVNALATTAILGLVLSLGPVLHWGRHTIHDPFPIPLPYALFYYILPGFQGFRNSSRWEMLFIVCMAIIIAFVLHKLFFKISKVRKTIIYLLLIAGCVAEFNFPMSFVSIRPIKEFPKVDHWLATTPADSKVIKLPIYNWGSWPFTQNEIWREYYSTIHFRKTVNGYTSFSPPEWQKLIAILDKKFPDEKTLKKLKDLGITYIVVEKDLYDAGYKAKQQRMNGEQVVDQLKKMPSVKLVKRFGSTFIFAFVD